MAPPPKPLHVIAQQLMTLVLQQSGIGRSAWREWLLNLLAPMQLTEDDVESVLAHMLSRQVLVQDGGILGMGPEGERLYGGKNFLELLSVFDTPPVFTAFSGLRDLGTVHPLSFRRSAGSPTGEADQHKYLAKCLECAGGCCQQEQCSQVGQKRGWLPKNYGFQLPRRCCFQLLAKSLGQPASQPGSRARLPLRQSHPR